ncbi:MAG: hypothetical protein WC943_08630 [Elusimicrobiota bacterium]|jgi:4-amino-4-deoxy-L-arabinose transferase-like glycosyltransferase
MTPGWAPRRGRVAARTLLACGLLIGGLLRLGSAFVTTGPEDFWNGEWEYYGIGVQLAEAGEFRPLPGWIPTAFRMPLYPAALSLVRRVKPGILSARILNAAADTAAIAAVAAAAGMLGGGLAGGLAAVLYAFFDPAIEQVRSPGIEAFFGLLVALALAGWVDASRRGGARRTACSAALLGLTLSCRSTLFLMPLVLVWVLPAAGWKARLRALVVLALGSLAFVLPWTLRNASLFRTFIPFENGAVSLNLWGASVGLLENPKVPLLAHSPEHGDFLARAQKASDRDRPGVFLQESFRNILRRPAAFLGNFFRRLPLLWSEQWLFLLLGLPLLAALCRPGSSGPKGAWVVLAVLGYFSLQAFLGVTPRYSRPAACAAAVAGSLGLLAALGRTLFGSIRAGAVPAEVWPGRLVAAAALAAAVVWSVSCVQVLSEALVWGGRFRGVPTEFLRAPSYYAALKNANALAVDLTFKNRTSDADYLFSEILVQEPVFTEARWNRAWLRRMVNDRNGRAADLRGLALRLEFPAELPEGQTVMRRMAEF